VEEKLLVNGYDERLNVSCRKKRIYMRCNTRRRRRSQMRRLAKLARGFILSVGMRVSQGLCGEQHEQDRRGKG
jgi:hypothetical protein